MKRELVASLLGIVASAATALGQGHVDFNSYVSTPYNQVRYANDAATQAAVGAAAGNPVNSATFKVQLFWALGTFGDVASFLSASTAGVTAFIDPSFTFGGGGYYAGPEQLIPGWAGGSVTFMVRGWETAGVFGQATYGAATLNGISGQTALWVEGAAPAPGANGIQPTSLPQASFAAGPPVLTAVANIPEPSTFALAGLGAAAMLILRRRK